MTALAKRLAELDWPALECELDADGYALTPRILVKSECESISALFDEEARFRKRIDMASHTYGEGEYRYFAYPLPRLVSELRERLYSRLAPLANAWQRRLRAGQSFPEQLEAFLRMCNSGGQTRPTPLLLRYGVGGYNRLHQDSYGPIAFPLQVAICLSEVGRDFTGGEFLLIEQRPRTQSRGEAITLEQGQLLIFPNSQRPILGKRGDVRVQTRHGVSRIRAGTRVALGIIFHDAQ